MNWEYDLCLSQKLFGFLLEYIGELATRSPPELTTVDKLIPWVQKVAFSLTFTSSFKYLVLETGLTCSFLLCFCLCRELYALCQMFPEAACKAVQSILGDAGHSMEEALEVKGHVAFPALDMVWDHLQWMPWTCQMFTRVERDIRDHSQLLLIKDADVVSEETER